jgi:hypothetical protein
MLGFSSFSCLRNRRRSNSIATSFSRGRSLGCKCQLADIAPVTSAVYGVILLGGGLFACKKNLKISSFFFFGPLFPYLCFSYKVCIFVNEVSKSGSKGSLFGRLTGAALMGTVSFA